MSDLELEVKSLQDLGKIVQEAKKWRIALAVIGGYAVRAYSRGYRFTKDIDLVTTKEALGRLKGLLDYLGYEYRETEFGIAGSKRFNEGVIDIHVSVGQILDISTGISIPVTEKMFNGAAERVVEGYCEESKPFASKRPVVRLETLLLLKLIPIGREKDAIDILALLIDKGREADTDEISKECEEYEVMDHLISQLRHYADSIRKREMEKLWFDVTGLRLTHTQRRGVLRFIRELINKLRAV